MKKTNKKKIKKEKKKLKTPKDENIWQEKRKILKNSNKEAKTEKELKDEMKDEDENYINTDESIEEGQIRPDHNENNQTVNHHDTVKARFRSIYSKVHLEDILNFSKCVLVLA